MSKHFIKAVKAYNHLDSEELLALLLLIKNQLYYVYEYEESIKMDAEQPGGHLENSGIPLTEQELAEYDQQRAAARAAAIANLKRLRRLKFEKYLSEKGLLEKYQEEVDWETQWRVVETVFSEKYPNQPWTQLEIQEFQTNN